MENNQSEVLIEDVSTEMMTTLLDVVDGQFYWPPSKEDLVVVLDAADRFLLTTVTKNIENYLIDIASYGFLTESSKNELACKYNMQYLKEAMKEKESVEYDSEGSYDSDYPAPYYNHHSCYEVEERPYYPDYDLDDSI